MQDMLIPTKYPQADAPKPCVEGSRRRQDVVSRDAMMSCTALAPVKWKTQN